MSYYYSYNYPNKKIKRHKGACSHCKYGEGAQKNIHGEKNGGWSAAYYTVEELHQAANVKGAELNYPITDCGHCRPSTVRNKR